MSFIRKIYDWLAVRSTISLQGTNAVLADSAFADSHEVHAETLNLNLKTIATDIQKMDIEENVDEPNGGEITQPKSDIQLESAENLEPQSQHHNVFLIEVKHDFDIYCSHFDDNIIDLERSENYCVGDLLKPKSVESIAIDDLFIDFNNSVGKINDAIEDSVSFEDLEEISSENTSTEGHNTGNDFANAEEDSEYFSDDLSFSPTAEEIFSFIDQRPKSFFENTTLKAFGIEFSSFFWNQYQNTNEPASNKTIAFDSQTQSSMIYQDYIEAPALGAVSFLQQMYNVIPSDIEKTKLAINSVSSEVTEYSFTLWNSIPSDGQDLKQALSNAWENYGPSAWFGNGGSSELEVNDVQSPPETFSDWGH